VRALTLPLEVVEDAELHWWAGSQGLRLLLAGCLEHVCVALCLYPKEKTVPTPILSAFLQLGML
jgi:hypothetical protein